MAEEKTERTTGSSWLEVILPAGLPENSTLPEKFYVAFRLDFGATYYGWAKVKYEDGELEWDKCAYNTTAGGTITAGDD